MLPIELSPIATLNIQNINFFAKKEFHISILATKKYIPLLSQKLKITKEQALSTILSEVDKFVTKVPIKFAAFSDEIRMAKREDRSSLIAAVKVSNIELLYDYLRTAFKMSFEAQPTHITLYTLENGLGIGINDIDELNRLSARLNKEESTLIMKAVFD